LGHQHDAGAVLCFFVFFVFGLIWLLTLRRSMQQLLFSYAPDEEDMVLDPNLANHQAHWGINMMQVSVAVTTL
jgi:hypothetical protein